MGYSLGSYELYGVYRATLIEITFLMEMVYYWVAAIRTEY